MLWLTCGILVVGAGFFVLAPLFKESKHSLEGELLGETERDRLLNRKTVLYGNLKDLELEYALGRLSDADFHQLTTGYRNEAASILQRLDQLGNTQKPDGAGRKVRKASRCPSCGAEIIPVKKVCNYCGRQL
jgi:hypothetical protein